MSSSQPIVPINRLPPETLTEIFSHTLSSGVRFMLCSPKFKFPISSPWALSLVCKSWKTLVYSTPSFWSSLSIDFVAASEVCRRRKIGVQRVGILTEALIRGFQNSLLRSRDHPLHISIISDSDPTAIEFLPQVLLLCLEHCQRWEGAYLEFWCDMLDLRFSSLLEILGKDSSGNKRSFPRLRNICLKGPGSLSTPASIPSGSWLRVFQDSPLLSSVWFRGDPHLFPELGGVFTWSNLTQFSTEMSSVGLFPRCNELLRTMHRLTVFKLTLSSYPSQPNIPGAEISFRDAELPELRNFWICLDDGGPYDLSIVFRVLPRTPRLSSFSLQPRKIVSITDDFLPEFADFISRSRCAITFLQIDYLPARQTMTMFKCLQYVEFLRGEGVYFDEELITHLTATSDGRHLKPGGNCVLLPRLRKVDVHAITKANLESYLFRAFESRRLYPAIEEGPMLESAYVHLSLY